MAVFAPEKNLSISKSKSRRASGTWSNLTIFSIGIFALQQPEATLLILPRNRNDFSWCKNSHIVALGGEIQNTTKNTIVHKARKFKTAPTLRRDG